MMNNIFAEVKVYEDGWKLANERKFNAEELAIISKGEVVASNYGKKMSVKFFRTDGGFSFIPVSQDSSLTIGEIIDLNNVTIQTLTREGCNEIYRINNPK